MRQIQPDLWVTEPEHPVPDEVPDLAMHAYLLVRDEGNVLFSRSEHAADHERIRELGGITHHYITHWHEAGPGVARIRELFGSQVVCHREAEAILRRSSEVDRIFDTPLVENGGIEIIPTPGHTPGSATYRYRSPHGMAYLFPGDTLFPSRGTWQAVVFEDGDKDQLRESLGLLRTFDPDVVLFGAAVADTPYHTFTPDLWRKAVDQAAGSLR